jgi:hypothetical protein
MKDFFWNKAFMGSGPSSGGVSSWNDLTDKPFSSETVIVDTVFDGDMTGREKILANVDTGAYAVKVTEQIVGVDKLIGSTMVLNMGGTEQSMTLTSDMVTDANLVLGVPGAVVLQGTDPIVLSLPETANIQGATFTSGTWFMCVPDVFYVKSLSCLSPYEVETVNKLDNKYLDLEWIPGSIETEIVPTTYTTFKRTDRNDAVESSNQNSTDLVIMPASAVVFGDSYNFYIAGKKYTAKCYDVNDIDPELADWLSVLFTDGDIASNTYTIAAACVDFTSALQISLIGEFNASLPVRITKTETPRLPEKYLPESVATTTFVEEAIANAIVNITNAEEVGF